MKKVEKARKWFFENRDIKQKDIAAEMKVSRAVISGALNPERAEATIDKLLLHIENRG